MNFIFLKKNNWFNWLKFIVWVPLVVITAIFVSAVNYNGLEWCVGAVVFLALLWVYRVSYSFKNDIVNVRYSFNLLGFYFLAAKINTYKVKCVTRNKIISFDIEGNKNLTVDATDLFKVGPKFKID